jgi:asparagine synthase (glutamine-hydrolysing)
VLKKELAMGAICGLFHKSDRSFAQIDADGAKMMAQLTAFIHETANFWSSRHVFFGNINTYVTPESKYEALPGYNEKKRVAITADAIIDNRDELLSHFGIPKEIVARTPDSNLIELAYLKWGSECPKHLIGDYAFAVWDEDKEQLFCARDHVGKRTFYYYHNSEIFAFSTTIKPLLQLKEDSRELNEEWIANNLATGIPLNQLDTSSTVYKDIFQLPPAHTMTVTKKGIRFQKYWDPLEVPQLRLASNEAYEEAFREVFFAAVRCRLRSVGSVGILLSSGLDSGSVACVAASMLKGEGKRLKAYTSVPFKGYRDWLSKHELADESGYIRPILDQYDNIDINFSASEGITAYNSLDRLTGILEFPFKYSQNFFWIDNLTAMAKRDQCAILLDGQSGNDTVSLGNLVSYFRSLAASGRWRTALREVKFYSTRNNRNYRSVLRALFAMLLPERMLKVYRYLLRRGHTSDTIDWNNPRPLINPDFALLWQTDRKLKKYNLGKYHKKYFSLRDTHRFTASALPFSQVAEADVKLSLAHGLTRRDPTRDKRVIEFCLSLPEGQLVHNGVERSIIRRAMKDILPDQVRMNTKVRGAQSADWIQRMREEWEQVKDEFLQALDNPAIRKYVDTDYARSLFKGNHEKDNEEENYKAKMMLDVVAWQRFLSHL